MPKILLLGGPSGSGKSTFASQCLTAHDWIHLEADRWPDADGIDHHGIRTEWDDFFDHHHPNPLHDVLAQRGVGHTGLVLSLPSRVVLSAQHLNVALGLLSVAYLYAHPAFCLQAFLQSPKALQHGLGADHWNANNFATFGALSRSENHALLIYSFTAGGDRRGDQEIYNDLIALVGEVD